MDNKFLKRQFLIAKEPLIEDGFLQIKLGEHYLSYHKSLPVHHKGDIVLIGDAWQVLPGKESPYEIIDAYNIDKGQDKLLKEEESWSGRYALIIKDTIYTDACGLLGVFYSDYGVSSSVEILREKMGCVYTDYHVPSEQFNWCPAPHTPYENIKRLLPSQSCSFKEQILTFRNPLALDISSYTHNPLGCFEWMMTNSLKNMSNHFSGQKIMLALTGGVDSRTLLTLMKKAGIPFECFTLDHDEIKEDDSQRPSQIAKILNIPYHYISMDTTDKEKIKEYQRFISNMNYATDRIHYACSQYKKLTEGQDIVVARSGLWELVTENKYWAFSKNQDTFFDYYEIPKNYKSFFTEYFLWCSIYPLPISQAVRFHWEQKVAGWGSANEHGFDLYDHVTSVQPLNSRILFTLLLTLPLQERIGKKYQKQIVHTFLPELSEIPYGQKNYLLQKIAMKCHNVKRKIRNIGLKRAIISFYRTYKEKNNP